MNERCGCGAAIEHVEATDGLTAIEGVREWRTGHRHEAPPLKESGSGGTASTERAWSPVGFAAPETVEARTG